LRSRFQDLIFAQAKPKAVLDKDLFVQCLAGMSDSWRRFCFEFQSFPFVIFSLVDVDEEIFFQRASDLVNKLLHCSRCADPGFSAPLLAELAAALVHLTIEQRHALFLELSSLLGDIAVFAPISSDMVEVLHGQLQTVLRHGRGRFPEAKACQERSVYHSVLTEYNSHCTSIIKETMPSLTKAAAIERPAPKAVMASRANKDTPPAQKDPSRKIRGLSGWSVFQRESMQGQSLDKERWKSKLQEIAACWSEMPQHDKEAYELEASLEQDKRNQFLQMPLSLKGIQDPAVSEAGRRFAHKANFTRLQINKENLQKHPLWETGLGLMDNAGALKSSLLDTVHRPRG
jgi:hypothetical protein